ncbi:MAG: ASCH/PUA domain-containing protein [Polyangiaceae bacterium]
MATHELKTWPGPFEATWVGSKTFELRKADRPFAVGDTLVLREYDPETSEYSGRLVEALVTYVLDAVPFFGLEDDHCIMSIRRVRAGWDVTGAKHDAR